jgi:hypothetical protein
MRKGLLQIAQLVLTVVQRTRPVQRVHKPTLSASSASAGSLTCPDTRLYDRMDRMAGILERAWL